MSHNYYSEINLHIVWHTKESAALLTPEIEPAAWRFLRKRIVDHRDVFVHEIGGTATHVHIAVSVPPTLTPSTFIGELKGGTSHDVNHQFGINKKVLERQAGYGVVSFGTKDLEWLKQYIRNQKEHHANGSAVERLERITQDHD
jgi:REP element-mobilizing transposase RayT